MQRHIWLCLLLLLLTFCSMIVSGSIFDAVRRRCFHCNGLFSPCISYSHVCDGDIDCPRGEDEQDCPFICPYPHYYRCSDNGKCIDAAQLCNGYEDCDNGEDEGIRVCDDYKNLVNRRFRKPPLQYGDNSAASSEITAINALDEQKPEKDVLDIHKKPITYLSRLSDAISNSLTPEKQQQD